MTEELLEQKHAIKIHNNSSLIQLLVKGVINIP